MINLRVSFDAVGKEIDFTCIRDEHRKEFTVRIANLDIGSEDSIMLTFTPEQVQELERVMREKA